MLILTRKPGQLLMIGDAIQIRVITAKDNRVRLAIVAPPGITISREEVVQRLRTAGELPTDPIQAESQ
jgi:carbon storage regulator